MVLRIQLASSPTSLSSSQVFRVPSMGAALSHRWLGLMWPAVQQHNWRTQKQIKAALRSRWNSADMTGCGLVASPPNTIQGQVYPVGKEEWRTDKLTTNQQNIYTCPIPNFVLSLSGVGGSGKRGTVHRKWILLWPKMFSKKGRGTPDLAAGRGEAKMPANLFFS